MANNYSYLSLEIPINSCNFEKLHAHLKETLHLRDKRRDEHGYPSGTMSWQSKYHVTLRYSGSAPADKDIDVIKAELDGALSGFAPIQLVFTKLGHFEGKEDNYPVYITCEHIPNELKDLQNKVDEVLKKYDGGGYYEFSPHLTLGRISKCCSRNDLQAALEAFSRENPFWIRLSVKDVKYHVVSCLPKNRKVYDSVYEKQLEVSAEAKAVKLKKDKRDTEMYNRVHKQDRPVIFIDMDNTIVDFSSALYKIPQAMMDAAQDGEMDNIPGIYAIMDPIPNAIKSVKYLASKYDVYILSTAPWDNPTAWCDKLNWIKRYLGNEMWKKLILSHNKHLNRGMFLIDDAKKNGTVEFDAIDGQEHIQIFTDQFPDWNSVVRYIDWKLSHRRV